MFEEIVQRITGEPVLLGIAIVIGIIAVLLLLKKLVKLAFGLFFVAVIVVGFIYFTSADPKSTIEKAIDKGQETIEEVKEKAKEVSGDIDKLKDEVGDKLPGN